MIEGPNVSFNLGTWVTISDDTFRLAPTERSRSYLGTQAVALKDICMLNDDRWTRNLYFVHVFSLD